MKVCWLQRHTVTTTRIWILGVTLSDALPPSLLEPIQFLSGLSNDQVGLMDDTLRNQDFLSTRKAVTRAVRSVVSAQYADVAGELAGMLMAFARMGHEDGTDCSVRTFTRMSTADNLDLTDLERSDLRDRLLRLITVPNLVLAARAAYVERDHEYLLNETGIRTDMRPQLSVDGKVEVIIAWHSLRIQYAVRDQELDRSQTVVLDHRDLIVLRDQINEALENQVKLQEQMRAASVEIWDPYELESAQGGVGNESGV